jgi:hypothetical protein
MGMADFDRERIAVLIERKVKGTGEESLEASAYECQDALKACLHEIDRLGAELKSAEWGEKQLWERLKDYKKQGWLQGRQRGLEDAVSVCHPIAHHADSEISEGGKVCLDGIRALMTSGTDAPALDTPQEPEPSS